MTDFLPQDYKVPQDSGNYMKFVEGENKFRILSSPIVGWEDWDDERNVYRFPMNQKPEKSKSKKKGARVKHFWAMVVWNYKEKKIQILNITQATVQKAVKALVDNPKWGKPYDYDFVITRTGESLDTEYQVMPEPKEKLNPEIAKLYKDCKVNLKALYENGDPFADNSEVVDPNEVNL